MTIVVPTAPVDNDGTANSVAEGAATAPSWGSPPSRAIPMSHCVTYSLTDDAGGRFAIDPTSGVVTWPMQLAELRDNTSHTITVQRPATAASACPPQLHP